MIFWIYRGRFFLWYQEWKFRAEAATLPFWQVLVLPISLALYARECARFHKSVRHAIPELCAALDSQRKYMAADVAAAREKRAYWRARFCDRQYLAQQWARDINAHWGLDIEPRELVDLIDPRHLFQSASRISRLLEAEQSRL